MNSEHWMQQALQEARKAYGLGEVPVGAIAVLQDNVIAKAHNCVELTQRATAHAEILCLEKAARFLGRWRLHGVTLYSTLEPCSMCLGAMFLSRIDRLVFAAKDWRQGACGSWINMLSSPHPTHLLAVGSGVLEEESSQLMVQFFKERRKKDDRYDRANDCASKGEADGLCSKNRSSHHSR